MKRPAVRLGVVLFLLFTIPRLTAAGQPADAAADLRQRPGSSEASKSLPNVLSLERRATAIDWTSSATRHRAQGETDEALKVALRNLLVAMADYRTTHARYPASVAELHDYRQAEGMTIRLRVDSAFWSATATSSNVPGITCAIRFGIEDDAMSGVAWCEPTVVRAAAGPVRIDLRNLIVAMETYWAEYHQHPPTLAPMSTYYKPGPGITIVLKNVSDRGWTATGTTLKMSGLVCRLVIPPPANSHMGDEPQCSVSSP